MCSTFCRRCVRDPCKAPTGWYVWPVNLYLSFFLSFLGPLSLARSFTQLSCWIKKEKEEIRAFAYTERGKKIEAFSVFHLRDLTLTFFIPLCTYTYISNACRVCLLRGTFLAAFTCEKISHLSLSLFDLSVEFAGTFQTERESLAWIISKQTTIVKWLRKSFPMKCYLLLFCHTHNKKKPQKTRKFSPCNINQFLLLTPSESTQS